MATAERVQPNPIPDTFVLTMSEDEACRLYALLGRDASGQDNMHTALHEALQLYYLSATHSRREKIRKQSARIDEFLKKYYR